MSENNGQQREFADVINQWTEECLSLNKGASIEGVGLIMRLGILGQRLLYEAHAIGMDRTVEILKEQRNAAGV